MKNEVKLSRLLLWSLLFLSPNLFAAPGTPNIAWMPTQYDAPAQFTVTWNMWWGENGNRWYLLENGSTIHSGDLTPNGNNSQTGSFNVNQSAGGQYEYIIKLCSGNGASESCTQSAGKTITISGGAENQPPAVNAGADASTEVNVATPLNGSYADDGLATPVTASWQVVSGAGAVSFVNQNQAATQATFASEGAYVLRLTVSDTEFTVSDEVNVTVVAEAVNQPPVANAGADINASVNQLTQLNGSYTDDGKSSPITESWTKVSGPGVVVFTDAASGSTSATFDAVGNYVLEYSVNDSEFTHTDQVAVTVTDALPPEQPGTPTIGWTNGEVEIQNGKADVTISWNLWWGANGNEWRLLQNGEVVHTAALTSNGSSAQSGSHTVSLTQAGTYEFVVQLCNVSGTQEACSNSASTSVNVIDINGWPTTPGDYPHPLKQHNESYNNTSGKMVAAYFVEWGIYGRNYHVADIPAENLTHIFYGFVPICGPNESLRQANPSGHSALVKQCEGKQDYEVVIHDKYAALEKLYPGDVDGKGVAGIFGQLHRMKLANPDIKIIPSVGGWTLSDPLYEIGINPAARKIFIDSMINYLRDYPFFDGIDIDWEFPGGGGANPDLGTPEDGAGFADLMIELRAALDQLSAETGRTYELAAAVNAGLEKISRIDWERAHQPMDHINVMAYDYAGAWNNELGHQALLYESDLYQNTNVGFYTDAAIQHLISRNVPPGKITVGVAMYGRGWKDVTGATEGNPFTGTGNGPIKGSWEDGIEDYKALEENFMNGPSAGANGFELGWDPIAKAEYLWNSTTGTLISLDTVRSTIEKGSYVNQHNLGGVFAWEIDADNGRILNAMHQGLGHPKK
ncbi:glycosyl hydrolase family 18 protein [Aliikangiella coralliicola]|uniref:chitinase n=1 Tax=Aliikangiella coralliicola TaxID=2592383 RepID=A0A545TV24_9GAMM|nr:glycosyl hydrolase family 18 protein [Aliikangiella coralliicola]TQV81059.1 hypothetical protein FLL46_25955 [Aliikangiella coralliicola]